MRLRAPNQCSLFNLENKVHETHHHHPQPAAPPGNHPDLGSWRRYLWRSWEMMRNCCRRVQFCTSPQASFPHPSTAQGPFGISPSPLWLSAPKFGSDSRLPARRAAPAGAGEPCGEQRGAAEKEAATLEWMPRRGGGGRGKAPGRGRRIRGGGSVTGSWASPPLRAPAADPQPLLREIR